MTNTSFDATVLTERRTVTISAVPDGYRVQMDADVQLFRRFNQALNVARDYLGRLLVTAERRSLPWGLGVCVSAGCAFYGPNPPRAFGGGGAPVPPDQLLAKIRADYRDGDGPIAALQNAVRIARAYPPEPVRHAA